MFELFLEKPQDLEMRKAASAPPPGDHEVKVRVLYGGICGSDLRVFRGAIPYAKYPCRPGHEILGTVIEAGMMSPHPVGSRVVSYPNTYCGSCEFCLKGKTNLCKEKRSFGVTCDGLFAQEITIDSEFVVPVPPDLPDERAILVEPFAVNVHALNRTPIHKEMSVAVIGCGTEGLLAIALLNHLGVEITAMDIVPEKMERAKGFGERIQTLHPERVKDEMFDLVVEAAGVKASIEQAFEIVKPGGVVISLGIIGEEVRYPALRITRGEITICGTIIYTKRDFEEAIALLRNPGFDIGPVLSKIVPLGRYREAFSDALSGKFVKIVLDFRDV
ncbi:MAG: alcohol dehydrogenase catalytic domain-containing protein [Desulfobacterota bacterium]|nr:alcohol dehydrogenase catalytic domain-containing protein [Thermodesulfobacteriota bacterium]